MPLLDHFHPPLYPHHAWEGFHGWWASMMAGRLNENLPSEYFAEFQVHYGSRIEVDVATLCTKNNAHEPSGGDGGVATVVQPRLWAPPTPAVVLPGVFPDDIEVQVYSMEAGRELVAAIELVSPGNKDREETRRAFAAKCSAYLQRGIGLIILDIVTSRHANLHDELMTLLGQSEAGAFPAPTPLYATAYRPAHRQERNEIDVWREPLTLGGTLPTLPLAVRRLGCLAVELESTYMEARKRGRIG